MKKGKVVLAGGVFDVLHPGHIFFLEQAKKLGDVLVVVIATDATVRRLKKRQPIYPAKARARIVASLKPVDKVVIGSPHDKFAVVRRVKPDIIAFGYDQPMGDFACLRKEGIKLVRIRRRLNERIFKTSRIITEMRKREHAHV
ncbi:MAG: adenylyltransferase/cytidyltransferase family protein [Candidatus Micrarchaeia archaeon]